MIAIIAGAMALLVVFIALYAMRKPSSTTAVAAAVPEKKTMTTDGVYTLAEVSRHCTEDDCWIIVCMDGVTKVYDITGERNMTEVGFYAMFNSRRFLCVHLRTCGVRRGALTYHISAR